MVDSTWALAGAIPTTDMDGAGHITVMAGVGLTMDMVMVTDVAAAMVATTQLHTTITVMIITHITMVPETAGG